MTGTATDATDGLLSGGPGDRKRVLMIDYYFPPIGGAGVRRTLGFVKHLAHFGWSPTVLSVEKGDHNIYDYSLLPTIPEGVDVQRTWSMEPVRFARRLLGTSADERKEDGQADRRSREIRWRGPRAMSEVADALLFPDRRIGWLPFAVARALALSRARRFDVLYSTSTSVTSHLIALVLKKILRAPWVADFQDPFVDPERALPGLRTAMGERVERTILLVADRVTTATDPLRTALQQKYHLPPDKARTVLLGFDPDAFHGIEPVRRTKFTITHFGSFYGPRSPAAFLRALGDSVRERRELVNEIEVLFIGTFDAARLAETKALLSQFALGDIVRLAGVVPLGHGLRQLVSSDILLLVTSPGDSGRNLIPSKLYDYLGAGRPILALTPDGAAAQIVRSANAGQVVHPDDVPAIKAVILAHYERWKEGKEFAADRQSVTRYTVRELTRQFAGILDDVIRTCGATPAVMR